MPSTWLVYAIAVAAALTTATISAQPDAFWCRGHLIREGISVTLLTEYCGEPASRETLEQPVMARRPDGSMYQIGVKLTEFWTYDRGPRSFPARITVEDGTATAVRLVSRE